MLPILLNIFMEQVQEDVLQVLRRTRHPDATQSARIEGYAAFLAGGIQSTLLQLLKRDSEIDEELFADIVSQSLTSGRGQQN